MSESRPWLATLIDSSGAHARERFATRREAETYVLAAYKRGDDVIAHAIVASPEESGREEHRNDRRR